MSTHEVKKSDIADAEQRGEIIQGLRELADWLEASPDVPLHQSTWYARPVIQLYGTWFEDEPIATSPKRLAKAMKSAEKIAYGDSFSLKRSFSGGIYYRFDFEREAVCRPVATKTEPVTQRVCTDEERAAELQAELDALHKIEVVGERTIVTEYDCNPVLGLAS